VLLEYEATTNRWSEEPPNSAAVMESRYSAPLPLQGTDSYIPLGGARVSFVLSMFMLSPLLFHAP